MTDYVISVRNTRRGEFGTEPGPTKFLAVPANKTHGTPDDAIARGAWVDRVLEVAQCGYEDPVTHRPMGDVLVFVHGYNNAPEHVLARHRLLEGKLRAAGYEGAFVSFDWPSNDVAINYLEDRSDARKTALRLVDDCIRLFASTQARGCDINVHLLAHSTGAYVIREGFDDADDRRHIADKNWSVSQIAFIAADVSSRSMRADDSKSSSIYRHCVRLTNYQNPYDSVLKLSNIKRVGVAPRVGRTGLNDDAPEKAVNVNCGAYFRGLDEDPDSLGSWSHSWHFGDDHFAKDLALTLAGDIDRNYIPTRRRDERGELHLLS